MREYNSAFFLPRERRNSIWNCANLLSKYPQTRLDREKERRQNERCCARLEAGGWLRFGGKSGSARSARHKRIREAEKARWKKGGRKEGKDYWKIEGDKGEGWWFGGCHHRFSMLDAPCLLAIVKG